jgi:hypothetical protein
MSLDCRPAAFAERRRDAVTIQAIRPIRAAAPSRIHSHSRLVPDPVAGVADALGETAGADVVVVTVTVGAAAVVAGAAAVVGAAVVGAAVVGAAVVSGADVVSGAVGPPVLVAVRVVVGKLLMMLLAVLPHPAARQATTRTAADRERLFAGYRMPILRVVPDQSTAVMISPTGRAGLIR